MKKVLRIIKKIRTNITNQFVFQDGNNYVFQDGNNYTYN